MKTTKKALTLLLAVLFFGLAHGETTKVTCFSKKKDPWQSIISVMHSYHIDTTGLDVTSFISLVDLEEINQDLAKVYGVKETVSYSSQQIMLGEIITDYMKVKYKNKNGEKYDYYRNRYNPHFDEDKYNEFMSKYPRSRHSDELKSKALCLDQNFSWYGCMTNEDSYETYRKYGVSQCPYPGFVSIANENNLYRKTLEDWDQLQMELSSTDRSDCQVYDDFRRTHLGHLANFNWVIPDSISQCQHRQQIRTWSNACKTHTVEGYQTFLLLYPDSEEAYEAERRIEDITAWQQAVEGNSHESYGRYYSEYPWGDSVIVAGEKLRLMEETAWQKAKKSNTLSAYENFVEQYPNGYYTDEALNKQLELEIKKFNSNKGSTVSKMELTGFSSQQGYSLLCFGNTGKNNDITISLLGSTPVKAVLKPGQSHWARVKNGNYRIYVTSSNGSKWEENGHGVLAFEDGVYVAAWYSYSYHTLLPVINGMEELLYTDESSIQKIGLEVDKRAQLELEKLAKQNINSKRKVLRNVIRQKLEEENNLEEYEKVCKELEDDENVDLLLKTFLDFSD